MNSHLNVIGLAFALVFMALAIFPRLQLLITHVLLRSLQICVVVAAIGFGAFIGKPSSVPSRLAEFLVSSGLATPEQLASSWFWLSHGLACTSIGVVLIIVCGYLTNAVRVNQQLGEIASLVHRVSGQVVEARKHNRSGAMKGAVETMQEYFRR